MRGGIFAATVLAATLIARGASAQDGAAGVDIEELVHIDVPYVALVTATACESLEDFARDQLGGAKIPYLVQLVEGVVSTSPLVVISGTLIRRTFVHRQGDSYDVVSEETVEMPGRWFMYTDSRRGGTCAELDLPTELELLVTMRWCDLFPPPDASCLFEIDHAYWPSHELLQSLRN